MKRFLTVLLLLLVLTGAALSFLLYHFLHPDQIEKTLIQTIEHKTVGTLTHKDFEVTRFPLPVISLKGVVLRLANREQVEIHADSLDMRLAVLPLIIGRIEIATAEIRGGRFEVAPSVLSFAGNRALENIHLRVQHLNPGAPLKMEWTSEINGAEGRLSGEATINMGQLDSWAWSESVIHASMTLSGIPVAGPKGSETANSGSGRIELNEGTLDGTLSLVKAAGEVSLQVKGAAAIRGLAYRFREEAVVLDSPKMDLDASLDFSWNPDSEEFNFAESRLKTPVGTFELSGLLSLATREFRDFRISGRDIILESLPGYVVALRKAIPFNIGFSGSTHFEMSLEGTADHLSLYANVDLTPVLLTYARFFVKPKDMPANLGFDFLLKDQKQLTGDFSVRFQEMTMKGTLNQLDLGTAEGNINIITNKFALAGWEEMIPPLASHHIEGLAKILMNLEGNLQKLNEAKAVFNLSIDQGILSGAEGSTLKNVKLFMDYGPVGLELKNVHFEIEDSSIDLETVIYNLGREPLSRISIRAPRLQVQKTFEVLRTLSRDWVPEDKAPYLEQTEKALSHFFPAGVYVEHFEGEVENDNEMWRLKLLDFEAFDGRIHADGEILEADEATDPAYRLNATIDHVNLARYLARAHPEVKALDGNLFVQMRVEGIVSPDHDWRDTIDGEGAFLVTNGELYSADVLGALAEIPALQGLSEYASGTTRFDDINARFSLGEGRLLTEHLVLISSDMNIEASGEITLRGLLNYRLDIFLPQELAVRVLDETLRPANLQEAEFFGPIPLLLSGPVDKLELQSDPAVMPELIREITRKRSQPALRNFLPAEAFFERSTDH